VRRGAATPPRELVSRLASEALNEKSGRRRESKRARR
jgi:hypothetical protein